jgi:hypothetical protein
MNKFESKNNNEILFEMKKMEIEHESIKQKMLKDHDRLIEVEKDFIEANIILMSRLKSYGRKV